ncbi:SMC-Scp complex subunit ScpB [Hufsiella ginkgonis]|uniref:SMC-Scp complex subunit ScpB n=1 Tax=Hufsiella ginkgonis TaxID=2695274 RepID=A0A7K1XYC9_9SPHI|nr:SMC-Scp complex subunit ScpB [Hufsiella ginkgonis]MXV15953.1 SMC-Scp complex subunit ScpB [Hufsiella ginkgonis]
MDKLVLYTEALIFASEQSVGIADIREVMQTLIEPAPDYEAILSAIHTIREKYSDGQFAIRLAELNGGYQFLTAREFYPVINQLQVQRSRKKLSQAALETLAIIAYRQPITKLEIEQIRGVNCDYSVQKLLDKELISISGKAETVGKPILYSTSSLFMDYFGINSMAELPEMKDISGEQNEIGEHAE